MEDSRKRHQEDTHYVEKKRSRTMSQVTARLEKMLIEIDEADTREEREPKCAVFFDALVETIEMFRPYDIFMNIVEEKLRELNTRFSWEPAIGYYRKIFGKDM